MQEGSVSRPSFETVEKIGSDGVISLESSSTSDTFVIIEEGMKVIKLILVLNMGWKILSDKSLENWHYIKVYVRSLWFYDDFMLYH